MLIATQEHRFGWQFTYQSSKYLETRHDRHLWVGTGPIVVDRRDGRLQRLGGPAFGDTVGEYQRLYDREVAGILPGPDGCTCDPPERDLCPDCLGWGQPHVDLDLDAPINIYLDAIINQTCCEACEGAGGRFPHSKYCPVLRRHA
ncbi:YrhB domain-containing protein [Streptacidiphilus sp. PAMC 29251]